MQLSPYLFMIAVLMVLISVVVVATFRNLKQRAALEVFVALLLIFFALLFLGLSLLITDEKSRFILHELKFSTFAYIAPCSLAAYLRFTGRGLRLRTRILLCVVPFITVVLAITNGYHHLFRSEMHVFVHNGVSYVAATSAFWYWIYSVYSYTLFLVGIGVLCVYYFKVPRIYRDQVGILVATAILAMAAGTASSLRLIPDYGDITIVCSAVVTVAQYIAIVRYSKKRVITRSRSLILGEMGSVVLIFNHKDELIDASREIGKAIYSELCNCPGGIRDNIDGDRLYLPQQQRHYSISDRRLLDKKGRPFGRVMLFSDITELKKVADELENTATRDYLTGLSNRSTFYRALHELSAADLPAAIISAGISDMKLISNIYGTQFADRLILKLAKSVRHCAADNAVCARCGGDEIAVILKKADRSDAQSFIKTVAETVSLGSEGIRPVMDYALLDAAGDVAVSKYSALSASLRLEPSSRPHGTRPELLKMLEDSLSVLHDNSRARSERIYELCACLARELSLDSDGQTRLFKLARFSDIGLISAPPSLVQNIGNLTNEQWEELKLHTMRGYYIAHSIPELRDIAGDILAHHERFDGHGYPSGISGTEIPLSSRILAVAEFIAVTPPDKVERMLKTRSGTQFDPELVRAATELS